MNFPTCCDLEKQAEDISDYLELVCPYEEMACSGKL
jgi:hypothetical protein